MPDIYLFIIAIIATLAIETILSSSWSPFYYRHGILLFKKIFPVKQINVYFYDIGKLNSDFEETKYAIGHAFGQIGVNEMGIRVESGKKIPVYKNSSNPILHRIVCQTSFLPMLHGYIKYNPYEKELTLKCFINWTVTIFLIGIFVINLPLIIEEISDISNYGSFLINSLFFIFIAFCIIIIPVSIALYQISQLRKIINYLLTK